MKGRIIVTGGAGFIGSAVVWGLNNLGIEDILIVDHMDKSGKERNLCNLKFSDYLDKNEFLDKVLRGDFNNEEISCIFHFGASTSTTERDVLKLAENNYRYSKKLACFALKRGVRFIYASSAATYGDGSFGFNDDESLLNKLKPLSLYGLSKHWFDLWAKKNKVLNKVVGLKYFNVFGPNEYHKGKMRSFVIKAYEEIKKYGQVNLFKSYHKDYKDGEQKRDFIYIKDAIDVTLFFFIKKGLNGIYNIGSGFAHTFNELVEAVFKALGIEPKIKYIDMPEELKKQYQYFTCADITKIRNAGYTKKFSEFSSAIREYVLNYLQKNAYLGRDDVT